MSLKSKRLGDQGEALAEAHLIQQGYQAVDRNFRCKVGEIDLILREGTTWVFVEVKTRSSSRYGQGREAVHAQKQRHMQAAALYYLQSKRLGDVPFRFDVVEIDASQTPPRIWHLPHALDRTASRFFW